MAKMSAYGCHEVAKVQYNFPIEDDGNGRVTDAYITVGLRSDGKVLTKVTTTYRGTASGTYSNAGAYSVKGTLKNGLPITRETLEKIAHRMYGSRYVLRAGSRKGY